MARIAGVNIPREKKIVIALTYIYGIGITSSEEILKRLKINPDVKIDDLAEEDLNTLRTEIEQKYKVEGSLRRELMSNIKRLKEIKSYRGSRHAKGLPARGQRTKTNSRTGRGNVRRTMGSGRNKAAAQKT